ncbi:MAG: site-2 protease family protein [Anaerolineales bacterium]|nr:site-2 protease family protein [Anaerolineales bacterium]MDW8448317.1 site-2 protease family protein [Anaerolineales bacterium]
MDTSLQIGKILGIPVGLHISWFLIFGLLTWSLASGYFPQAYPELSGLAHLFLAVLTSGMFFTSVLAHELGHSIVALREKIPVRGITLFIFGGIAQIAKEPPSPGAEFRIAIAGPIVSFLLAGLFGLLWYLDRAIPYLAAPSEYLMRINFILAAFNMIPGFPLDGGRVLRSIVWKVSGSFHRANQVAAISGQLVAFGFIGFGVFTLLRGQFFNGLWLVFIGWFLQNAAATAYAQTHLHSALQGLRVADVMNPQCNRIPGLLPLSQLVEDYVLTSGQRCFIVVENEKTSGVITLKDITAVPQGKWRFTTARQAMVPFERMTYVTPQMEVLTALRMMDDADVAQLPVVENGELIGILTREHVLHMLRLRAELGM